MCDLSAAPTSALAICAVFTARVCYLLGLTVTSVPHHLQGIAFPGDNLNNSSPVSFPVSSLGFSCIHEAKARRRPGSLCLFRAITHVCGRKPKAGVPVSQRKPFRVCACRRCFPRVLRITGAQLTWAAGAPTTGGEVSARAVLRASICPSHSWTRQAPGLLALYCLLENKVWAPCGSPLLFGMAASGTCPGGSSRLCHGVQG